MGENDGNKVGDNVGELAEGPGVELRDTEEDLEELAEVRADIHTVEAVDEAAEEGTDQPMDEPRDYEDYVQY